jgi:hypothetical protein
MAMNPPYNIPPACATSPVTIYLQGTKSNAWLVFEDSCISRGFDEEVLELRTIVLEFQNRSGRR